MVVKVLFRIDYYNSVVVFGVLVFFSIDVECGYVLVVYCNNCDGMGFEVVFSIF